MNNDQFRRLVHTSTSKSKDESSQRNQFSGTPSNRGNVNTFNMAPRSIKGAKQFKSIAPKGSKFGTGYRDRAQDRRGEENDELEDKAKRIAALEKSLKDGEIDSATFESLRDEITGGQIENTHLVKGLDWKLLERVRRGEDLNAATNDANKPADSDEEFEELEKKEVKAVKREETQKAGNLVKRPSSSAKQTRDQILAELKASRKRAAESTAVIEPRLSGKFRKIGEDRNSSRMEIDKQGREMLLVTDAEGNVKRKVRKAKPDNDLLIPNKTTIPLGADVYVPEQKPEEESDGDIYADIGANYDLLAAIGSEDSSDDDDAEPSDEKQPKKSEQESRLSDAPVTKPGAPRNYFNDDPSSLSILDKAVNPLMDSKVLATLAAKNKTQTFTETDTTLDADQEERLKQRAAMLSSRDRDLDDMDMGFGSSRFDDAEEMAMEGSKVKLSEWGADDNDSHQRGEKSKKKRPPKQRKGDKNSVADVLRVMEGRKS